MKLSDFKFRVKPLEIIIVVAVIVIVSFATICIKNYVREEELNNLSLADKTPVQDGDTVVQIDDNIDENVVELNTNSNQNSNNNSNNTSSVNNNTSATNNKKSSNKIVIKKGSTGVLQIPSINVLAQITEGSTPEVLKNYVGVVEGSSRPGQVGNYSLAAHNNIDTEIFKNLHKIEKNDLVYVYTQSKMYTYKVVDKYNVKPTQTEVLDKSTDKKEITLITCNYNATERVIVKGILVSEKVTRNVQ